MRNLYLGLTGFIFATMLNILTNGEPKTSTILSGFLLFAAFLFFTLSLVCTGSSQLLNRNSFVRKLKDHKTLENKFASGGLACLAFALLVIAISFSWLFFILCLLSSLIALFFLGTLQEKG